MSAVPEMSFLVMFFGLIITNVLCKSIKFLVLPVKME